MKENKRQMPSEALNAMLSAIERYFECHLNDEEEACLRKEVALTTLKHPAIDEARAVMGLCRPLPTRYSWHWNGIMNTAASIAVLVVAAIGVFQHFGSSLPGECVAYVNGHKITDHDEVMKLFIADFDMMCSGVIDADNRLDNMLEIIDPAIEEFNSVNSLNI